MIIMTTAIDTANDGITYFFISLATVCSFINLVLIVSNCEQMVKNTYCRMVFVIQLMNFLSGVVGYPVGGLTACKVTGALFYFFFLVLGVAYSDEQPVHVNDDAPDPDGPQQ